MKTRHIFSLIAAVLFTFVGLCAHAADDLATITGQLEKRKADLRYNQEAKAALERFLNPANKYFFFWKGDKMVAVQGEPDKIKQDLHQIGLICMLSVMGMADPGYAAGSFWDPLLSELMDADQGIKSRLRKDYETIKKNIVLVEQDIRCLEEQARVLAATRKAESKAPATPLEPTRIWEECEDSNVTICGTWTYNEDNETFEAVWKNGAKATLKLRQFDGKSVRITRNDLSGASKGLQAHYTGRITPTGIVDGKVTWSWGGRTWSGTWKANW